METCEQMVEVTALNRSLSKYPIAQDTRGKPTITKHNRTFARLINLLYLQPWSTIKVNRFFSSFFPLYLVNWSKTKYSSEVVTKIFSFYTLKTKQKMPWFSNLIFFFGNKLYTGAFSSNHLLSKIIVWNFKCHFSLGSIGQKLLKLSSLLHLGFG